jgi:hypothetical protein
MKFRLLVTALCAVGILAPASAETPDVAAIARVSGAPEIPGLKMVWLAPWGEVAKAHPWRNIIVHQTEGPAGSARGGAQAQAKNPTRRGVTVWVETDGTVYWAVPEDLVPTHGDGANRNDNLYIDNAKTFRKVIRTNSIGVEFVGNHPDVSNPVSPQQMQAWLVLVRFLQERYGIPAENIFAHNWVDFKDKRYCEGCDLATAARKLGYVPTGR